MPRMVFVNDVGKEHLGELLGIVEETRVCTNVRILESRLVALDTREESKELCQVQFKVLPINLNYVIKELRTHGFSTFDVVDILSSTENVPRERKKNDKALWSSLFPSTRDRLSTMEIHNNIVNNSKLSFDHCFLIFIASFIASVGLLGDNIVNILASFFVSPLMSMIMAATWGIVIGDRELMLRGLRNMACGASLAWLNGVLIGLVLSMHKDYIGLESKVITGHDIYNGISIDSEQIRSRGPPAAVNLVTTAIIAALSGVSIALGQSSGISTVLSGVTVAASLLPPLVNSGLCTVFGLTYPEMKTPAGYGLHAVAVVSAAMYFVTVACVMIFSFLTFKFKHVGGMSFKMNAERLLRSVPTAARSFAASFSRRHSSVSGTFRRDPTLDRPGRDEAGTELVLSSAGPPQEPSPASPGGRARKVSFAAELVDPGMSWVSSDALCNSPRQR